MSELLRIDDLSVAYRSRRRARTVLDRVSLTVESGTAVGLVGESGCGKSTLALSVLHALPPNGSVEGGTITVAGQDVAALQGPRLRDWWSREVALVQQDPVGALTPSMTVGAQLAEVCRHLHGGSRDEARDRAAALFERVALTPASTYLDRYPHQLSGGQRQRAVIAMALAGRPRLLVLDEPTTGQDAVVESELIELIAALRGEFIDSLLFITHNLDLVARTCDRVAVLYAGRIVEEGGIGPVLRSPAHPYTAALLACTPRSDSRAERDRLPQINGAPPAPGRVPSGCAFAPRCAAATPECRTEPPIRPVHGPSHTARCFHPQTSPTTPSAAKALTAVPAPAHAGAELLELRGIGKRYGRHPACADIDLTIRRGETLGLVGMSGSGKTTIARIIAGLIRPDTGEIRWAGTPVPPTITRRSRTLARALQWVPQHPDSTLNPGHRVRSILKRAIHRLGGELPVDELATSVRLEPHHLDVRPNELSGGLRQRVAIARAFAGRPELVVCDEPVSSLDVSVQASILNLLADLQADRGTSYLFISHDLRVIRFLSHRVAVIYAGRIVETGPTDQVFAPPFHPYTETLVTGAGDRPGPDPAGDPTQGCPFHTHCPRKIGPICETQPPPAQHAAAGHTIRCHIPAADLASVQGRSLAAKPAS